MIRCLFQRLSLPYICRDANFVRDTDLQRCVANLKADPCRGPQLRAIRFWPDLWGLGSQDMIRGCMSTILSHASRLTSISSFHPMIPRSGMLAFGEYLSISWSGIETLAHVSGPNMVYLLDISIPATSPFQDPTALSRFSALRELACKIDQILDSKIPISSDWLPCLRVLKLRGCHSSFFGILSILRWDYSHHVFFD